MQFADRQDAGRRLAERLLQQPMKDPVVLALPRGGLAVGFEIARALSAPLDLVLVRKIGAPRDPELAVAAIADGPSPELVTLPKMVAALKVSPEYLQAAKTTALHEIERRRSLYLGERPPIDVTGRTAVVVDDGVATGATMLAALRGTRKRNPARIILAVPVAARDSLQRLRDEADETICLDAPAHLIAVGLYYQQFPQLNDDEVIALLDHAQRLVAAPPSSESLS